MSIFIIIPFIATDCGGRSSLIGASRYCYCFSITNILIRHRHPGVRDDGGVLGNIQDTRLLSCWIVRVDEWVDVGPLGGEGGEGADGDRDDRSELEGEHIPRCLEHGDEVSHLVHLVHGHGAVEAGYAREGVGEIKAGEHAVYVSGAVLYEHQD